MKKLYFVILFAISSGSFAQVYHPIPTDSVYWVEQEQGLDNMFNCYFTTYKCIYPTGNVVIQGNTYTEYRCNSITNYYAIMPPGFGCSPNYSQTNILYTFLRNDTIEQKVYAYDSLGNHQDVLIFDFSVNIGDTVYPVSLFNGAIYSCAYDTFLVSAINYIDIGGELREKISLNKTTNTSDTTLLIEGIGSNFGLAYSVYCPFEFTTQLVCFDNNNLHYSPPGMGNNSYCTRNLAIEDNDNLLKQFIFPISNNHYLIQNEENNSIKIICYDMLGKFILEKSFSESGYLYFSETSSGVYIMYIEYNGQTVKPYKFIVNN
jgi:hypothetical protein